MNTEKLHCPVAQKCGGCQYLAVPYKEQLAKKQRQVDALLKKFHKAEPIIGMENPYFYRNKVHAVCAGGRRGNIISGMYQEGTHKVLPVEKCFIEDEKCQEIIRTVRELAVSFKYQPYNEDTHRGLLRHIMVRRALATGEIMVILVLGSPVMPSKNNFVKALRNAHPEITTIVQNINSKNTSMVLGDKGTVLYGKGYIKDVLCGCKFRISPKSFYQVNPVQTEILYNTAIRFAGLTGKETVIDAYCGIGTIGIAASKAAGQVIGIELNRDAVADAERNAKENDIANIRFFQGDAGEFMVQMAAQGQKADVVLMDPPRAGSDEKFLNSLIKTAPDRVVYVSCNPVTLARDLEYLVKRGYRADKIQPVDMFPMTGHVETVVLLSKGEMDSKKV